MHVFKNVLWVYSHKICTAVITLFSTPIILGNVGVEDFGVYTLTIGLVAMFGFINWSLTSTTQRFITVGLVNQNKEELIKIFNTSFFIHLAYGLLLLIMILTFGNFFTGYILDIPSGKVEVAKKVLAFVAIISFFQMIGIPFQGLLQAYENLKVVSIIGVIDSILKLTAAFLLSFAPFNRLIFFSTLMSVSALIIFLILFIYCFKKYSIISLSKKNYSSKKFKEMMEFASWNIIGAVAILGRNQGLSIVLNIYFGVIANAAYGVSLQIQAALGVFSQGIVAAMTPRILKSAGKNENDSMIGNAYLTAKYGLFVMSFVCIPLLINMQYILDLWLKVIPQNTIIFSKLIIIFLLCTALSVGIQTIFNGINKVKIYNLTISLILLMNIPIATLLFEFKFPVYSIFLVSIALEVISFFVRLLLLKKYITFSPLYFLRNMTRDIVFPFIFTYLLVNFLANQMILGFTQLFTTTILSTFILSSFYYTFSIDAFEKNSFKKLLRKISL